jgi:uncharacterized Zn finger protein
MQKFSRTWWGDRFIKALESFTNQSRLQRGRSYASGGKVLSFKIEQNHITARVKGSINAYFGVDKEPTYNISIEIKSIPQDSWKQAITKLAAKASIVSRLLLNEVPENIEDTFMELGLHLLPHNSQDFKTRCSCPDSANPCKHIAGVYYLVASQLDENPFLLFEMRGLSKIELQKNLANSPLGQALSYELLNSPEISLETTTSFYPELVKKAVSQKLTIKEFWMGTKRLPDSIEIPTSTNVSAILIKKQGDFPAFWRKNNSFIETMEELYQRVKTKNQNMI